MNRIVESIKARFFRDERGQHCYTSIAGFNSNDKEGDDFEYSASSFAFDSFRRPIFKSSDRWSFVRLPSFAVACQVTPEIILLRTIPRH